ncbi:MAG: ABC transporter ATP-binding protein [Promethearchaeota archaeon]
MAKLELRNISMKYQQQAILSEFNLTIKNGELLVLLGDSGCGKTTLIKIIAGIIAPESGEILMGDQNMGKIPSQYRKVGYVPQSQVLFPHLSIRENVIFGLKAQKLSNDRIQQKLKHVTNLTAIGSILDRFPSEISGGQKQRVALARAMAVEPQILLLDEPLSSIDATNRESLAMMIRKIQQNTRTTVLYVTHNQEEARLISDQIAIIANGKIQQQGRMLDIERAPRNFTVANIIGLSNLWAITSCTESNAKTKIVTTLGDFTIPELSKQNQHFSAIQIPPNVISCHIDPPQTTALPDPDIVQKIGTIFAIQLQDNGYFRIILEVQHQQFQNYLKIETKMQKESQIPKIDQDVWITFAMKDILIF